MRKLLFFFLLLFSIEGVALPKISVAPLHHKAIDNSIELTIKSLKESTSFQKLARNKPKNAQATVIKQLQETLKPYGYFEAKIKTLRPWHYAITLNQRVYFNHISLSVTGKDKAALLRLFQKRKLPRLRKGQAFSSKRYQKTKDRLLEVLERHGFIKARFIKSEVTVDLNTHTADVNLIIDPEKRYYFGDIHFSKTVYPVSFLKRYAPWDRHTPFSQEKLLNFEQNLQSTPYFSKISIKPEESEATFIPIDVTLKDAPKQQYLIGGGYGTDTGFRGRAGLLRLFESGNTFQAEAQVSQLEKNLQAQYVIPGYIPYKEQTSINANLFHLDYEVGTSDAALLSIKRLINDKHHQFELGLNGLYEDFQYTDREENHGRFVYPTIRYSKFEVENPLFSKKGYSLTLKALAASKALLSDESVFQGSLDLKAAFWVKQTHTRFFLRGTAGLTDTDNIYNIPLSMQQLLGGANNLDAYQYQSIGPGELLLFGRAEWQQEIKADWFVTASYALGDVYHPQPFAEKRSVGLGVMYASPIGLVKAGVAKALDLTGRPIKLIVSMGPDL